MNQEKREEFVSAFLDGELTSAEELEVRKRMESDPATRHQYDDFLALRETFRQLPRESLPKDFSEKVLAKARSRKSELTRRAREQTPQWGDTFQRSESTSSPTGSLFRRFTRPRTLLWPGLALSVALLFMLMQGNFGVFNGTGNVAVNELSSDSQENPQVAPKTLTPPDMVATPKNDVPDDSVTPPPMSLEVGPSAEDLEKMAPHLMNPPEKVVVYEIDLTLDATAFRRKKMAQILAKEMVSWTKKSDPEDGTTILETHISPDLLVRVLQAVAAEPEAFTKVEIPPAVELLVQQNLPSEKETEVTDPPSSPAETENPKTKPKDEIVVQFRIHSQPKGNPPRQAPNTNISE
jgi:hypothetical protein